MTYDAMSNPLRKIQKISGSTVATSHDLTYLYNGEKPDAASQIGENRYTYDDNGNPTLIVSDSTTRTITWDEENRMVMLNDDGYVSRYTYDFSGTRVIKSHGPQESVYINGAEQGLDYHDADNYTLYVSPYLIVNNERFTKHYYAGTQRIASKVGSGEFYNVYGVNGFHLTAGDKDYKERLEQIEEGVKEYYNANGIPPGEPTMKGSNADPYVADVALPNVELGDYSVPTNWPTNVKFNEPGDVSGPVIQFEDDDQGDVKAGYGFESDNLYEGDWFFFHTDHLGSTSYLTDTVGNVSQFVCYTPYGEAIVDEHLTTYENPFKFSGKELDDITGLYDHGARSRNPISTLWYGVDPLFEKYPDFSPYNYCGANPARYVDPTGLFKTEKEAISYAETHDASAENVSLAKDKDHLGEWYVTYGDDGKGYVSGGTVERRFYDKKSIALNSVGKGATYGSLIYGSLQNAFGNKYWWRDAKGTYHSTQILEKQPNGKYIRGVQGYRNSYNSALKVASKFGKASNVVGVLGLGVTALQYRNGDITAKEALVDGFMGTIGIIGGPIGAGVSCTYFLGKMAYEYFSDDTLFEKPK